MNHKSLYYFLKEQGRLDLLGPLQNIYNCLDGLVDGGDIDPEVAFDLDVLVGLLSAQIHPVFEYVDGEFVEVQ